MEWYQILMLLGVPTVISSGLLILAQSIYHRFDYKRKKEHEDIDILKLGVQAMLRDRLRQGYRFFKRQGYIDIADKENFDNMYQQYHRLGKNGVMDGMYREIMSLPTDVSDANRND